ncbi:MAG: ABC transporter permease [Flexilinea sp.]
MQKSLQHTLTMIVTAVAIGLSITVMLISSSVQQGMVDAAMPFDMIVGAKGSPSQLLFNAVFLQDTLIGNVPQETYEQLSADERVQRVIPFAFGDNYKGYRIVGSSQEIFELRPSLHDEPIFSLKEGRFYADLYEVVLGSTVAKKVRLEIGDTFKSAHGLLEPLEALDDDHTEDEYEDSDAHDEDQDENTDHHHDTIYTVVGILNPMNRPYDTGIFTPIESIWGIHGNTSRDVTALMVTPVNYSGLMQMYQEINNGKNAQAVFPGVVMADIFEMLGQSEEILTFVSFVVLIMALITIIISLYWSVLSRRRENAILRAIGAGRRDVLLILIIENAIVVLGALILGLILGHLTAYGAAVYMKNTTALYSPVRFMAKELYILGAAALVGIAVSLIPAITAYRADVAKNLQPQ